MCVTEYGSAMSFGLDVKSKFSLCSTPNIDLKDPDITEEEILLLSVHTETLQTLEEGVTSGHWDPRLEFSYGSYKKKGCFQCSQGLQVNFTVQPYQPSVRMTVEKAVKS